MSDEKKVTEETAEKKEKYADLYEEVPFIDTSVKPKKSHKKAILITIASILGLLAIVYFGGVIYYSKHFAKNSTLNGFDLSKKTVSEAEEDVQKELDQYELSVDFKDASYVIAVGDGQMQVSLEKTIKDCKSEQNPFLWPSYAFGENTYESDYVVTYDEDAMKAYLDSMECMLPENMKESINARIRLVDGEVVVNADVTGTTLDKDSVYEAVFNALDKHENEVNIESNDCYVKADVTISSDVIAKGVENAKDYLTTEFNYDFNGSLIPLSKEDLCSLAYVDENGNICLSKTNVESFAKQFVQNKSTCYTYRDFKTHDGRTLSIYGGSYGWSLDEEKCIEEFALAMDEVIAGERSITIEPACHYKGYTYDPDGNDIGNTYIEIDLKNQHVYAYVNGRLEFETDCVTGNTSAGMNTPGGLYGLRSKSMHAILVGPGYETPVTYWMPFNGGIGLHDATWRGSFGGSIYYYNGSHGCVNLPFSAAATIYDIVEPGMPIVCYWD